VRIYVDSSALIKRSVDEAESEALDAALDRFVVDDAVLVTSSLAWIEVSRALRAALDDGRGDEDETIEAIDVALSGVAERPITDEVVGLARRIAPPRLCTLDAIHLATAVLLDVDVMLTYDSRLVDACRHNGVTVLTPS
jgi:predicted nucleic acid-binding protein